MKNKYVIIGTMALIFSGIIFSLIFLILLNKMEKEERKKITISLDKPFMEKLNKFLMYGGYWVSVETWFGLQVLFIITAMIVGMGSGNSITSVKNASILLLTLEALLYGSGKYEMKKREIILNQNLCRLQEALYFQSDTGVERKDILLAVYEKLEDPIFKNAIKEIIFAYSLQQDVIEKIEALKSISNNMNVIVFSNTLIQDFRIGESDENIEAQATVTKRLISNRAIIDRKSERFKMIVIGVVLMMLFVFLMVTPTFIEFTQSMNKIIG